MNYEYNPNDYDFNDYVAQSNNKINSMQKYNQNNYENGGNNYKIIIKITWHPKEIIPLCQWRKPFQSHLIQIIQKIL